MPDPQTAALQQTRGAARVVVTREGYVGASMDAVEAEAGASKRTVHRYFEDKRQLFAATVLDTVDRGYKHFNQRLEALADAHDVERALGDLAHVGVTGLMDPELLKMGRLVIAEAEGFPDIGREYYERSWVRTLALLADACKTRTERRLLFTPGPESAAYLFTRRYVLIPANRAAFRGDGAAGSRKELLEQADEAVRVLLSAHGVTAAKPPRRANLARARDPAETQASSAP